MAEYIFITNKVEEDAIEIPSEDDGTILLSTLQAQFPEAIGLRYKVESRYRALKLSEGRLYAPLDGWQDRVYFCVFKNDSEGSSAPSKRRTSSNMDASSNGDSGSVQNTDLVVLGLPWSCGDNELREYFEQFGTLEFANVKMDKQTGRSKGFGFIRFTSHESALKAMLKRHRIGNRFCDVRVPESTKVSSEEHAVSHKVFVGSLSQDITEEDLRDHFEQYGTITEVLIPKPFREFGFIKFECDSVARSLIGKHYKIKDTEVIVMEATPKRRNQDSGNMMRGNNFGGRNDDRNSNRGGSSGYGGGNNFFDNRQIQPQGNNYQQSGYKKRRNDYDDWHGNNSQSSSSSMTHDVLQAVVSKAVSEVLSGQKNIDPWGGRR